MAVKKRTTHRSRSGSKLYAKRDTKGEFEDIQTYKRAHGQDVKRVSKAETAAKRKKAAKKKASTKKTATKKTVTKKKTATKKSSTAPKSAAPRKRAATKK